MIEIIYDHRMSLRDSAIRHFIIHKGTIILLSHFRSFYFKCFKVAAVILVIDLVVKWYKIRMFFGDIIHNCLFETASKIEIFEPEQIALILYPLKDCFKIRDTGEYRGYETNCTDTCLIAAIRCSMLEAESISFLKFSSSVARLGLLFLNGNCRFNSCDYIQWCLL